MQFRWAVESTEDWQALEASVGDEEQAEKYLREAFQYGHGEKARLATAAQIYADLQ